MTLTTTEFAALYSIYSWPNVVLCFFGGFLIDRWFGIRLGAIIFSFFILAGQLVFALGAITNKYWLALLGRFIFGLGGESLAVAQNTYAVSWFKGKELNMVFGLRLSFSRVGSTAVFNVMVPIYEYVGRTYSGYTCLGIVLFLAAATCIFSQFCAFILAYYDRRAERILNKAATKTDEVIRIRDIKDFSVAFWMLSLICVFYYVAVFPFVALGT